MLPEKRTRVLLMLLGLLFAFILNWSYQNVESDIFEYQGLIYRPPIWEMQVFSAILTALPFLWMPIKLEKPSDLASWLSYLTFLVPCLFFTFHVTQLPVLEVAFFVLNLFLAFALFTYILQQKPIQISGIPFTPNAFAGLLLLFIGLCTAMIGASSGFHISLSLEDAYQRRLDAREMVTGGSFAGYALAWMAGSFAPIAIIYGLAKKRFLLVAGGTVGLLAIFSFSGTKSSLFTPLILLLLYVLVKTGRQRAVPLLIVGTTAMVFLSAISWTKYENPILSESFTRRLIDSKGVSSAFYWEEFRDDPVYMSDSIFARLAGLPPVLEKTYRIGMLYGFGDQENYNANAWASMFANFGYLGLYSVSILMALFFKAIDGFVGRVQFEILCVCSAFLVVVWGEQAFETSLLSSGVLVTMLMLMLMCGAEGYRRKSREQVPAEALSA